MTSIHNYTPPQSSITFKTTKDFFKESKECIDTLDPAYHHLAWDVRMDNASDLVKKKLRIMPIVGAAFGTAGGGSTAWVAAKAGLVGGKLLFVLGAILATIGAYLGYTGVRAALNKYFEQQPEYQTWEKRALDYGPKRAFRKYFAKAKLGVSNQLNKKYQFESSNFLTCEDIVIATSGKRYDESNVPENIKWKPDHASRVEIQVIKAKKLWEVISSNELKNNLVRWSFGQLLFGTLGKMKEHIALYKETESQKLVGFQERLDGIRKKRREMKKATENNLEQVNQIQSKIWSAEDDLDRIKKPFKILAKRLGELVKNANEVRAVFCDKKVALLADHRMYLKADVKKKLNRLINTMYNEYMPTTT